MEIKIMILKVLIIISIISHSLTAEISSRELNHPKIIGGTVSGIRNERHFASIRLRRKEEQKGFGKGHNCGGTLIRDNIILTAAHCLFHNMFDLVEPFEPTDLTVVLGSSVRTIRQPKTVVRSIEKILHHPEFDITTLENDIGLILLNETALVVNNSNTAIINLTDSTPDINTKCRVSGFGHTAYQGQLSVFLQTANVDVLNTTVCNNTESYDGQILDGMFCAGLMDGSKDACAGDSGGPLVCNGVLTGIVSGGKKCGMQNLPGVYVDVNYYRDWIDENIDDMLSSDDVSSTTSSSVSSSSSVVSSTSTITVSPLPTTTAQASSSSVSTASTTIASSVSTTLLPSTSTEKPANNSAKIVNMCYVSMVILIIFSTLCIKS